MPIKKSDLKFNIENLQAKQAERQAEETRENAEETVSAYLAKFRASDIARYKEFCIKRRLTLRKLIETSVDYLVRQCEEGNLVISSSGVYEKK